MKKGFFILILVVVFGIIANAQDVITLKNGTDINAFVQKVGDVEIEYKKFENPNGPNYTLKKTEILIIRYANGSKDIFTEEEKPIVKIQEDKAIVKIRGIIITHDGKKIEANDIKIGSEVVRYKNYQGIAYLEKIYIASIVYEDGSVEVFSKEIRRKYLDVSDKQKQESVSSVSNRAGEISIGLSPVISFPSDILLTNFGFYGKLRVGVANPIRLEGCFAYYLPRNIKVWKGVSIKMNMWEVGLNAHLTLKHLSKNDKFLSYPLIGFGVMGLKGTVLGESFSTVFFGMNAGVGFDIKLYKKLFFNTEVKYLITFSKKAALYGGEQMGGRTMISSGLLLKFN